MDMKWSTTLGVHIQSTPDSKLPVKEEIAYGVLSILAMAPSSFAALHGYATRMGMGIVPVLDTWNVLRSLEHDGAVFSYVVGGNETALVEAGQLTELFDAYQKWLSRFGADPIGVTETSIDEIGMWFEITPHGRAVLDELASQTERKVST